MPGSRDTNHVVASDCRGGELGILSCNTISVRTTPRRDCDTMGHYGWICNVVSKSCHASNPKRQGGQKYIYKFCTSLDDFDVNTINKSDIFQIVTITIVYNDYFADFDVHGI